jgi:hypothetical protein
MYKCKFIHKRLLRSLTFGRAREYFWVVYVLAPFSPTPTSFDNTLALSTLHFKSNAYFPFFLKDYEPDQDLKFSYNSFKLAFQRMSHLSANGPFGMVFKHLQNIFHPKDSASGFPQLFQLYFHIAQSHIPPQIAHVLGTTHLLAMTKPSGGVHPIVAGETLY